MLPQFSLHSIRLVRTIYVTSHHLQQLVPTTPLNMLGFGIPLTTALAIMGASAMPATQHGNHHLARAVDTGADALAAQHLTARWEAAIGPRDSVDGLPGPSHSQPRARAVAGSNDDGETSSKLVARTSGSDGKKKDRLHEMCNRWAATGKNAFGTPVTGLGRALCKTQGVNVPVAKKGPSNNDKPGKGQPETKPNRSGHGNRS